MTKKKIEKEKNDEESEMSNRESSSESNAFENGVNINVKSRPGRKCKQQSSVKKTDVVKRNKNGRTKGASESSCDDESAVKNDKVEENTVTDVISPQEPTNVSETKIEVTSTEDKDIKSRSNGDNYFELLNYFKTEDEFNAFRKKYSLWQESQSDTDTNKPNLKKVPHSRTPKKPAKGKTFGGTPMVKLVNPTLKSKKSKKDCGKKSSSPKKVNKSKSNGCVTLANEKNLISISEITKSPVASLNKDIVIPLKDHEEVDKGSQLSDTKDEAAPDSSCVNDLVEKINKSDDQVNAESLVPISKHITDDKVAETKEPDELVDAVKDSFNNNTVLKGCKEVSITKESSIKTADLLVEENLKFNSTDTTSVSDVSFPAPKDNNSKLEVSSLNQKNAGDKEESYKIHVKDISTPCVSEPQVEKICKRKLHFTEPTPVSNVPFSATKDKNLGLQISNVGKENTGDKKDSYQDHITNITPPVSESENKNISKKNLHLTVTTPVSDVVFPAPKDKNLGLNISNADQENSYKIDFTNISAPYASEAEGEKISKRKLHFTNAHEEPLVKKKNVRVLTETFKLKPSWEVPCSRWSADDSHLFSDELIYSDDDKYNCNNNPCLNNDPPDDIRLVEVNLLDDLHDEDKSDCDFENDYINPYTSLVDLRVISPYESPDLTKKEFYNVNEDKDDTRMEGFASGYNSPSKGKNKPLMKVKKSKKEKEIKLKKKLSKLNNKSKTHNTKSVLKKNNLKKFLGDEEVGHYKKFKDLVGSGDRSKKSKRKHKGILDTDLPIVEVTYKGESLHGILGEEKAKDYFKIYSSHRNRWNDENFIDNTYVKDILKKFLRPLCRDMLTSSICILEPTCKKYHSVNKYFFNNMNKYDAWLIISFVLRISVKICRSFIDAIFEFLGNHKAKIKIFLIASHILSCGTDASYSKFCWELAFKSLEKCWLQRSEAMKAVIRNILDSCPSLKSEVFLNLLKIWGVHSPAYSDTWGLVEPLVTQNKITLPHFILSKIICEMIANDPEDINNTYQLISRQLACLSQENFNQINFRLLNDFLRKLAQEGMHKEEILIRDRMIPANYSTLGDEQPSPDIDVSYPPPMRRCKSMINLAGNQSGCNLNKSVVIHEEEKMEAAVLRALQCFKYDSVINVLVYCSNKNFVLNICWAIYKFILDKNPYKLLKILFTKLKENSPTTDAEVKDLIGNITVTVMLDFVKKYKWKEAGYFYSLLDENSVNKYKLKSLIDSTLRPVRLAVTYSEIHYYNGRYKESIGVFISTKLLDPEAANWSIPGGTKEDFGVINVMILFLMNELMNKKIINVATMLFKSVVEVQTTLSEPIDIRASFELLLYKLFEFTDQYPETAVRLFTRVLGKDNTITLNGLTYRALIILSYRNRRNSLIKDLIYKAIGEYAYPLIEENENVIMLLKSFTEEEIIVYITEWVARFKVKLSNAEGYKSDNQIQIKFKDMLLEDYLDDQVLGIPGILKEVDQSIPGAMKRLERVLKIMHIKYKHLKKDALSIDPLSFQNVLSKVKYK